MNEPDESIQRALRNSGDQSTASGGSSQHTSDTANSTEELQQLAATVEHVYRPPDAARPTSSARKSPLPKLPGYEILDELGRGGMGVVYRAKQDGLDRVVAIKMLLAADHADDELLARFQTEAQAVATLQHPNIVQIYEIGRHQGLPFFSLEFVPGGSLAQKIGRTPQPPKESAQLVETLARAVEVAHRNNIVHRDLKPANVLLAFSDHSAGSSIHLDTRGHKLSADGPLAEAVPKISDFGLAKRLAMDSQQTRTGQIMGSPSYMAPEQARGDVRQVGPLADVYALGAILYELLTGRPPFLASNPVETVQQVVNVEPIPPSRLALGVPRDLETICLKCLQKDPRKRYTSAEELANDLHRFLAGVPIVARPVSGPERLWRWCQRNPLLATSTAFVAVLLLVITAGALRFAFVVHQKNLVIEQEKQTALDNAQVAGEQSTLAVRIIQLLVQRVQQKLGGAPATQSVRKEILDLASQGLTQVANRVDSSTSKEATQLSIHVALGELFAQLGEMSKALEQFQKAEVLARERVIVRNHSDSSRSNLAKVLRALGQVTQEVDRDMSVAQKFYDEALEVQQSILDKPFPGDGNAAIPEVIRYEVSEDHMRGGVAAYKLGDPAAAMRHWQKGLELREALRDSLAKDASIPAAVRQQLAGLPVEIARSKLGIGELSFRLRDPVKALAIYAEITAIYDKYLEKAPTSVPLKTEIGRIQGNYGDLKLHIESPAAALPHYERSRALMQELVDYDSNDAAFQQGLALAFYRMGNCALRSKAAEQAARYFSESLKIREQLVALDQSNDRRRMELMLSLAHCGDHERAASLAMEFLHRDAPDNELLIDVARCLAQCSAAAGDNAGLRRRYADDAVNAIQLAKANNYQDTVFLETEPDLDPLRETSTFQLLLQPARSEN